MRLIYDVIWQHRLHWTLDSLTFFDYAALLYDVLDSSSQAAVGHQLWRALPKNGGFVIGSCATSRMQRLGLVERPPTFSDLEPVMLLLCGSVTPSRYTLSSSLFLSNPFSKNQHPLHLKLHLLVQWYRDERVELASFLTSLNCFLISP